MSDAKLRRGTREPARGEAVPGESVPPEAAPVAIAPEGPDAAATKALPEPVAPPVPSPMPAAVDEAAAPEPGQIGESVEQAVRASDDAWTVLAEMQAAWARGCEELALEMTAITRSDVVATTEAATAMLGARTFAEAVEISAGLVRRRADAMIDGSARLSEIGVQTAAAASRPLWGQPLWAGMATGWSGASRN